MYLFFVFYLKFFISLCNASLYSYIILKKNSTVNCFRFATVITPKKCQKLRKIVILSIFVVKTRQKPPLFCFFTTTQRSYFGTLSRPSYVDAKARKGKTTRKSFPVVFCIEIRIKTPCGFARLKNFLVFSESLVASILFYSFTPPPHNNCSHLY